jgi:uncharacterized protein
MNKNKSLLIIFYRNPELGKVKSRLAATIGEERALAIYILMATHARKLALTIPVDRVVYYSEFIDREDNWPNKDFNKRLQQGNNLGEKMKQAFEGSFKLGYASVCIIGTDCLELTEDILQQAFESLKQHDTVIGPAADGGYYLLGMNKFIPEVFNNKKWSTDSVLNVTLEDMKQLKLSCHLLPTLSDVDIESDLPIGLRQ